MLESKKSALLRELLSNNSLFVSQLYDDKSLALRARDLIYVCARFSTQQISRHKLYFIYVPAPCVVS